MISSNRLPFTNRLRQLGFKQAGRTHICFLGGATGRLLTYEKVCDDGRRLKVQLWPSGYHRVSHWMPMGRGWRSNGVPTSFSSIEGMEKAIERETKRKCRTRAQRDERINFN